MAYYYKVNDLEEEDITNFKGLQVYEESSEPSTGPCITYDFSKHVLIELIDNVTSEARIWKELGVLNNKIIMHKRLLLDPHRMNCRRAIVVCSGAEEAKEFAERVSQVKIMKRSVCAVVIQELLSDLHLFEKQIMQYGDKRSQQQLVYVTDLNRRREPAGLADYLKEKFSPFGTILSVFVSEDKAGYAHSEGIVRFAHLSEAFAAELAFDQCVVAMERLSVATHHNILLSQCDLKARLREAQLRYASEATPSKSLPNSESTLNHSENSGDNSIDDGGMSSNDNAAQPEKRSGVTSDSAELLDVMENTCNSNLVDCLKSMNVETESLDSTSKATSLTDSESTDQNDMDMDASLNLNLNNSSVSPKSKTWSTRILGWITDLPSSNGIPSNNVPTSDGDLPDAQCVQQDLENTAVSTEGEMRIKKNTCPSEIVSCSGSFVTCRNDDTMTSCNSNPSSPINTTAISGTSVNANTTLHLATPEKDSEYNQNSNEGIYNFAIPSSSPLSISDLNFPSTSQKRKNTSLITQKLSLKSQRLDNSESAEISLENETTVRLSSIAKNQQCSVVLNSVPELNELAKNFALLSPVKNNETRPSDVNRASVRSEKGSHSPTNSSKSCRRSSRLALSQSDASVTSSKKSTSKKNSSSASVRISNQRDRLLNETENESPLRSWLKHELASSTNNRMAGGQEGTKSIVCATINRDVLISVGCSHMTCDFCYPDSTKLLLGFH